MLKLHIKKGLRSITASAAGVAMISSSLFAAIPLVSQVAHAATATIWSDNFGTGSSDNEIANWEEEGTDSDSHSLVQAPTTPSTSEDGASPDGDRFAKMRDSEWICRQVDATGYTNLTLSYYWKEDVSAEDNESGIVEYFTGGTCDSPTGLTTLASHELDDGNAGGTNMWSSLETINLSSGLNNTSFYIRFRNAANQNDEHFRIDGVTVAGDDGSSSSSSSASSESSSSSSEESSSSSSSSVSSESSSSSSEASSSSSSVSSESSSSSSSSSEGSSESSSSSSSVATTGLSVTKVANVSSVAPGNNVIYTITVSNSGNGTANGVTLTDILPGNMSYVSAVDGGGAVTVSCTLVGPIITCPVSGVQLHDGESFVVTVEAQVSVEAPCSSTITNTATVSSLNKDPAVDSEDVTVSCSSSSSSSSSSESSSSENSSSSESSSSSSASSESSSSSTASSEGSSESTSNVNGFSTEGVNGQNGSHRGNDTNRLGPVISLLGGLRGLGNGTTAPGAFGGSATVPLSDEEIAFLCTVQKSLPNVVEFGLLDWMAQMLAAMMNRPVDVIADALRQDMCATNEPEAKATVAVSSVEIQLDGSGVPVSSNTLWNKCIRGETVTLAEIKQNVLENEHEGRTRNGVQLGDCGSYHTGSIWYYPDLGIHFEWNGDKQTAAFPKGYVGVKNKTVASN